MSGVIHKIRRWWRAKKAQRHFSKAKRLSNRTYTEFAVFIGETTFDVELLEPPQPGTELIEHQGEGYHWDTAREFFAEGMIWFKGFANPLKPWVDEDEQERLKASTKVFDHIQQDFASQFVLSPGEFAGGLFDNIDRKQIAAIGLVSASILTAIGIYYTVFV